MGEGTVSLASLRSAPPEPLDTGPSPTRMATFTQGPGVGRVLVSRTLGRRRGCSPQERPSLAVLLSLPPEPSPGQEAPGITPKLETPPLWG